MAVKREQFYETADKELARHAEITELFRQKKFFLDIVLLVQKNLCVYFSFLRSTNERLCHYE